MRAQEHPPTTNFVGDRSCCQTLISDFGAFEVRPSAGQKAEASELQPTNRHAAAIFRRFFSDGSGQASQMSTGRGEQSVARPTVWRGGRFVAASKDAAS